MEDREAVVAICGSESDRKAFTSGLGSVDATVRAVEPMDDALTTLDPIVVVALDEDSLRTIAGTALSVPVLAVESGPAFAAHDRSEAVTALEALLAGSAPTVSEPVLTVTVDGSIRGRALFDVLLTTSEPAAISAFSVDTAARQITSFRADGVVAATPAGSEAYARAAGGPVLGSGTTCLAVVPIAPFRTRRDHWVLALDARPVMTVERDEEPVSLVLDGQDTGTVSAETPVVIERGGSLTFALASQ